MSFLARAFRTHRRFERTRVDCHARSISSLLRPQDALIQLASAFSISSDATGSTRTVQLTPSTPKTSSFLEDATDEYADEWFRKVSKTLPPSTSGESQVLVNLILKGDFTGAQAAKDELLKLGVPIEPHALFLKAAHDALDIAESQQRKDVFIGWVSLLPQSDLKESLPGLCERLLHHPFDLALHMDFCSAVVKAGYYGKHGVLAILKHIFRYTNPDVSSDFLSQLEQEARSRGASAKDWMSFRNLAIRMHCLACRVELATRMLDESTTRIDVEPATRRAVEVAKSSLNPHQWEGEELPSDEPKARYGKLKAPVTTSDVAARLRLLRRAVVSLDPPHFESYLADFMYLCIVELRRIRALVALRTKVFKSGTLGARVRWVSAEQLMYSSGRRSIANLRAFRHHFLVDQELSVEIERVMEKWEKKRTVKKKHLDWRGASRFIFPTEIYGKLWPSSLNLNLAWKAVIQLSDRNDLDRLYSMVIASTRAAARRRSDVPLPGSPSTFPPLKDGILNETSIVAIPPAVSPNARFFHHFVVAFATHVAPRRGGEVLGDMLRLGINPILESWCALAGAYARSGDSKRVWRIIEYVERNPIARVNLSGMPNSSPESKKLRFHDMLTNMCNSIMRGYTECGMYPEARAIQRFMEQRGYITPGNVDKRTRSILHRLSRHERGIYDKLLANRKYVFVDRRRIYVDRNRTDWLRESEPAERKIAHGKHVSRW